MSRAYSANNVLEKKFDVLEFEGEWEALIGKPELRGHWFIHGQSGNGKTNFALKLAKYLCQWEKVGYNSIEEGLSLSMKNAMRRAGMQEVEGKFTLIEQEPIHDFVARINSPKGPKIGVIDSFQAAKLTERQFLEIKLKKGRQMIWISHAKGNDPRGDAAVGAHYYSFVKIHVEGFKAHCKSRYLESGTTSEPYTIWKAGADKYYANINK